MPWPAAMTSSHARGETPPYGFSRERIAYAIVLSDAGEAVAVSPLPERSGNAPGPTSCEVPHAVRRTSRPVANFLWDKTAYVFGVKRHPVTRRPCPANGEHDAFRELHEGLLAGGADDKGLQALLCFLRVWDPNDYDALPHAEAMLGLNVIFRLQGEQDWLHERPEAKLAWAEHLARTVPAHGTCLITGARAPIALVHPAIKGVRGTHAAGAALVTFNLNTFESYGKTQGANAPISIHAAFAYTTALNALLAPESRRRVRIGDMTVVFWADVTDDVDTASQVEALLWHAIVEGESAIGHTLEAIARGEPLAHATPELPPGTRLDVLGLAANVGRLSVRLWHVDTLGGLARRIVEHWDDLRIEPAPWPEPPPARLLLYETARQRNADRIPPALGPALLRAILSGGRYPRTLLAAVIARIRAEKAVTGAQAAICRACLARDHRLGFEREDAPVSLDRDETHPAYRLGRLFAVYERVQRARSAPSTPASGTATSAPPRPRPRRCFRCSRASARTTSRRFIELSTVAASPIGTSARSTRFSTGWAPRSRGASGSRTKGGSRWAITTSARGSVMPARAQIPTTTRAPKRAEP